MKKLLPVLTLFLIFQQGFAQPILDASNWFDVGDSLVFREAAVIDGVDPGLPGADISWDFSSLSPFVYHGSSGLALDPSEGIWNDSFPEASVFRQNINGANVYYNKNADSLLLLGSTSVNVLGDTIINKFADHSLRFTFPLTFGTSFTDVASVIKVGIAERIIDMSVEIDGWGTIETPAGVYDSVVRSFRQENSQTITFSTEDTSYNNRRFYTWFHAEIGEILTIIQEENDSGEFENINIHYTTFALPEPCTADAGTMTAVEDTTCMVDGEATVAATENGDISVPPGYDFIYVLTSGAGLVIEAINLMPDFTVTAPGLYTVHTFVYSPNPLDENFLDLSVIEFGVTTGADVINLIETTGICASLDPVGATVEVLAGDDPMCFTCTADAGTLTIDEDPVCMTDGSANVTATPNGDAVAPAGYSTLFVLTSGAGLVIEQTNSAADFDVDAAGDYTIHTLIYTDDSADPDFLDLSVVVPGTTTGVDVLDIITTSGICASLDAAGAPVEVLAGDDPACFVCTADAGTITVEMNTICLKEGDDTLVVATAAGDAVLPAGYSTLFVLTSGDDLVIEATSSDPEFTLSDTNAYTIHTLIYTDDSADPNFLDLSVVVPGTTTGGDVAGIISSSGICASLDVAGAAFDIFFTTDPACVTGIFDAEADEVISLYPNPASDVIAIEIISDEFVQTEMRIFNQLGQLISSKDLNLNPGEVSYSIDVSDLPSGIYFLNINGEEGTLSQQFIKE